MVDGTKGIFKYSVEGMKLQQHNYAINHLSSDAEGLQYFSLGESLPQARGRRSFTMVTNKDAIIESPEVRVRGASVAMLGVLVALMSNVASFIIVSSFAPRTDEGIRSVVALPWATYVSAAHLISLLLSIAASLVICRSKRSRTIMIISASATILMWYVANGASLLHRDFVGKL